MLLFERAARVAQKHLRFDALVESQQRVLEIAVLPPRFAVDVEDADRLVVDAEKPDVALDRVHTYCVKRFRVLLASRNQAVDAKTPLDAIFGAYGKALRDEGAVSEFALPTLRVQHKLFDGLNQARNKRSFAHDNELLHVSEAQFIIDSVLASLAFIERIEASRQTPAEDSDDEIPF